MALPPFPIVDTHVHLWDPKNLRYSWLEGHEILNQPHLLSTLDECRGDVEIERIVFVQCDCDRSQYRDEVEWVTSLSKQDDRLQGMVAFAPCDKGDGVKDDLAYLAANPFVKGVRQLIQEEGLEFCVQPDFVAGVKAVGESGLSFDLCIYHVHLPNTIELVKQCPDVQFVLDHIGKPDVKNYQFTPWDDGIKRLAELDNVYCKLSGIVTEADHHAWKPEELTPYIEQVVEAFGIDRVMFGGDWPVSRLACDYPEWVQTLYEALSGLSEAELRKVFVQNAVNFYRL